MRGADGRVVSRVETKDCMLNRLTVIRCMEWDLDGEMGG